VLAGPGAGLTRGATVAGYTVLGVLGEGGMGMVYLAEQRRPRRTVALKLMRPAAGAGVLARFEQEAEVLGRLQHPGIARIYEAGTAAMDGRAAAPFIAMELVNGVQLGDYARGLDVPERLGIVAKVCDAVHYAHQRGIVHRDLKPGNLMVDELGQPKVLDFGVARAIEEDLAAREPQTEIGQMVGTLQYMSPEQVRADAAGVDARADVYALGVVLFELLSGRLPHDPRGASLAEMARLICEAPAPRLGTLERGMRGDVETIVGKALEKEPERRYQSAAELADDLRRYLDGRPIAARDDSALYVLRKRLRRYRGALIAGSVAIGGLAVLSLVAFGEARRSEKLMVSEAKAKSEALDSLRAAKESRGRADESAARLAKELAASNIERARLLARAGNLPAAEDLVWPALLADPADAAARWALWDVYAHQPCVATFRDGEGEVTGLSFSPDGRRLYTAGQDGDVRVWSTGPVRQEATLGWGGTPVQDLSLSADGRLIAVAEEQGIAVWDVQVGHLRWRAPMPQGVPRCVSASADGKRIAAGGRDGVVRVWDGATGESLRELRASPGAVTSVRWSPDGRWIALVAMEGSGRVKIWDAGAAGTGLLTPTATGAAAVAFRPGSGTLAVGGQERQIEMWDVGEGRMVATLHAATPVPRTLAFTADGRTLLAGGWWSTDVWDVESASVRRSLSVRDAAYCNAITPDGALAAAGFRDGWLRLWDLSDRGAVHRLAGLSGRVQVAVSPDGRLAVTGSGEGTVCVRDTADGRLLAQLKAHDGPVVGVALASGGAVLATASEDQTIKLWDLRTGAGLGSMAWPGTHGPGSMAMRPDGGLLAAVGGDGSTELFAMPGFERRARIPASERAGSLAFEDAATLDLFTSNGRVRRWRIDGDAPRPIEGPEITGWMMAVSPDGTLGAVAEPSEGVRIWDLVHGRATGLLPGGGRPTMAACFIPGSPLMVASASADGSVRLWEAETGRSLATLEALPVWGSRSFSVSADGRVLAVGGSEGAAAIWDLGYFERHIAGNAEYQASRAGLSGRDAAARVVESLVARPRPSVQSSPDPEVIAAWGSAR
jgi:WD40 repeat protein/predicted Ser/Thr protein kinase